MNPPSGPRTWTSPGAVHDLLRGADARARSWRYIWRAAASCPVGDEEDSLRWLVRERNPVLRRSQADLRANGSSAAARHIPARYVTEAVGRPYTVDSHVSALSRLVLGMESPGGEAFAQLDIYTEVDQVAVELEAILGRRAAVVELSNFALTRVDASPALFPTLARLRQVYRDAAGQEPEGEDGQADDEGSEAGEDAQPDYLEVNERRGNPAEVRFVTLVERYALSTCIDGCPACLAGACDLAGPTLSRQLLSRRLLRRVLLGTLAAEAVDLDAASTAAEAAHLTLSRLAPDWFVVRGRNAERYVEVYQLLRRDCSPFEEIVDYASGETIAIFQRAQHADT